MLALCLMLSQAYYVQNYADKHSMPGPSCNESKIRNKIEIMYTANVYR